jgi:hypothetical protein
LASVIGNITDNDTAGVTVTPTTVSVTEGGATGTYTIVLNAQPNADVTITVNGDAQASVSPTSLTFTPANWNIAQNVTVTAVDDLVVEGAHTGTITHSATGSGYTGVSIASVTANIIDNDTAGVTVTPTTVSVTEGGATGTYTIVLNAQPNADVTITVNGDAQASVSPTSLTFTPANWNIAQNVTVTAVDDLVVEGAHTGTITHSATGGGYTGVSIASVTVNITDNDVAASTELLKNGGFEIAGNKPKKAKRWKAEAPAVTDKRICRPAIAFEGSCAYRFHFNGTIVGGGAKRAIVQKILSPGLNAGDTLDFSFYARTSSLTIAGRARVIAYYSGGGKQVIKVIIPAGSSPYTLYAGSAVLNGTPASITVTFEPRRSKGTMFVDGASLTATASTRSFLGADVLPVPDAPEGFRR